MKMGRLWKNYLSVPLPKIIHWPGKNEGAALIISLLIVLSLALLGLAILLQSNTEHMIAVNERDSTAALYNAEAALQLIRGAFVNTNDVDYILRGPDDDPATLADNGLIGIKDYKTGVTIDNLNNSCGSGSNTCERTVSVLATINGKGYEAFRIGQDLDGDGNWDGPRGLVFIRGDDNYDEAPAANDPTIDQDRRINVTVISRYPVRVVADGSQAADQASEMHSAFLRTVGVSQRTLFAQFGPDRVQAAIVSRTDMTIANSFSVCGECGSIHADETLTIGGPVDICKNATSTDGPPIRSDNGRANIGNPPKQSAYINVPIANPYHKDYVPDVAMFDTSADAENAGTPVACPAFNAATNPGGSKYFAFVGNNIDQLVFKAYWDTGANGWRWELIDVLNDGNNTTLDDCGRVVSSDFHATDPGAGPPVNDGDDDNFYDFTFSDGSSNVAACNSGDDATLSGTDDNDFGDPVGSDEGFDYVLPGRNNPPDGDGNPDFVPEDCMHEDENIWHYNGGDVWSPTFNSVIFIYGNLLLNGGPDTLCSSTFACNKHKPLPGGAWRVSLIVFNNIDAGGTPAYGPTRSFATWPDKQYVLVAGRDIHLRGNSGGGKICPRNFSDCGNTTPMSLAGFAGFIRAHEQLSFTGSATVNGVIQAEDAATCSPFVTGQGVQLTGNGQLFYDCEHPPSSESNGMVMTSWHELNQ